MDKCIFCKIINEESRIINNNNFCFSILSNPSLVKGHSLVIPKRHVEKLEELSNEELMDIFKEIIKLQKIILNQNSGCTIKQNFMPFLEESNYKINHLHFHLIPRENNDEIYLKSLIYEKDIFRFLEEMEVCKVIKEVYGKNAD